MFTGPMCVYLYKDCDPTQVNEAPFEGDVEF